MSSAYFTEAFILSLQIPDAGIRICMHTKSKMHRSYNYSRSSIQDRLNSIDNQVAELSVNTHYCKRFIIYLANICTVGKKTVPMFRCFGKIGLSKNE